MSLRITFDAEIQNEIEQIIAKNVDKILINSKLVGLKVCKAWEDYVSEKSLIETRKSDIIISETSNLINFSGLRITNKFIPVLQKVFTDSIIQVSGYFHYPDTGFMSWHTNSDIPCKRLYITWSKEGGKSFFRYFENGKVITDYDDKGITVRMFNITDKPPYLWHCVGSETDRLSFGFRII
jgi:hypothetical protein